VTALGILETTGCTAAMVALDVMEKASRIRVVQAELNDFLGICIKFRGGADEVRIALEAGLAVATELHGQPIGNVILRPDDGAWKAIHSPPEFNPLIQQDVVHQPRFEYSTDRKVDGMTRPDALGFIETQGFTAVFAAIDAACKAANVDVVGKEKLGGGYVTVIIQGDVAAVRAAIESATTHIDGLGTLIASHVVTRPSEGVLGLLPKM
jgi:microcompartment protein CcmL/EutN